MVTIKVFSSKGVKELNCFDTLENVPVQDYETYVGDDPFDDIAEMESERQKEITRQNFADQFGSF